MEQTFPRSIVIASAAISALGIFVGLSLYLSPGTFIQGVDFNDSGTRYLAHMWAARQIAIASALGFAALKKSRPMLSIVLAAYCVMNVQDALIGVQRGDTGLAGGATFFCLLSVGMVYRLNQRASV